MNIDFEEYLRRQSFRPIPAEWRAEILRAAQGESIDAAPARRWREWLWPCPQAWVGLAAAWALVFLLHSAAPVDSETAAHVAPLTWQTLARLQHEMEAIAQTPDSTPLPPTAPQPRTCRDVKQNMG